jgi:dienelactone hydrolase
MTTIDRARTRALAAGVLGLGLALTGCSSDDGGAAPTGTAGAPGSTPSAAADASPTAPADAAEAPAGDAFYEAPDDLGTAHGALVWHRPGDGATALPGAATTDVLYSQVGIGGELVGTSGFVSVPEGPAPEGGWPVVAWAHGTTGLADTCAPTRDDSPDAAYPPRDGLLAGWVADGYAVVGTDYEGLGTPGDHPYLDGRSQGRAVLDAVTAARQLDDTIGDAVVVAGHSQGAHAALWASAIAPTYSPDLDVRGTVAIAPPSHLSAQVGLLDTQTESGATATVASILRGAQVIDPDLDADRLLTARGAALYPDVDTTCLRDLGAGSSFGGLPLNQLTRPQADLAPLTEILDANDPGTTIVDGTVLLAQGTADTTVISLFTDLLAEELETNGSRVDYRTYRGATHGSVLTASRADVAAYLERSFA